MIQHWTPEADAELTELYKTLSASEIGRRLGRTRASIKGRATKLGLKKSADFTNHGRFLPGQAAWNKGKEFDSGGRSHETRFQPGQRSGRALERYLPVGSERITKDGYIQIKVNEDATFYKRWRFAHVLTWEAAHGPVPKGHVVSLKNRDPADGRRLENLEIIHRRELMQRNTVHNYPEELVKVIRLKSVISRKINRINKEQRP